ncbi:MAG: helix-turn-helix transcriptional regulator [Anaerolineales bacterium]|jgi:transcriptional regulator with XRE-family HTH domain
MRGKNKMRAGKSAKDYRFSKWLKAELERRNITQVGLSRATGIRQGSINHLLWGGGTPKPDTLNAIADGLLLPREELYRVVGFLPPLSREGAHWEQIKYKYSLLSQENQAKFDRFLDFELLEQKRGKASKK